MAVLYSFEKGKLGGGSGFIYVYARTMTSSDPDDPSNVDTLPAGFLKCDGTIYQASLFPALAGVLGVGTECRYRGGPTGTQVTLTENQFRVPDLGAKVIRASQTNIGEILNGSVQNAAGTLISKSGVGALISNNVDGEVDIGFSGNFKVPVLTVDMSGNPGWTTDANVTSEGVTNVQLQPHAHYSTTVRLREADNLSISVATYRNSHTTQFCTSVTTTGYNNAIPWGTYTDYFSGQIITSSGNYYTVTTSGWGGWVAPSHTSGSASAQVAPTTSSSYGVFGTVPAGTGCWPQPGATVPGGSSAYCNPSQPAVFLYTPPNNVQTGTANFDTNKQDPIVIAGRNLDVVTEDGGDDTATEHAHPIFKSPGIFHQSEPTGQLHDFKCNLGNLVNFTGTVTNNSASITSVSTTTGLAVGQPIVITTKGIRLAGGATISSISGSTVTLSSNLYILSGSSSQSNVSFRAVTYTEILPDGLNANVKLTTSSAVKFDDISSPFILVQYLIKT